MTLPLECRRRLNEGTFLAEEQLPAFWGMLQQLSRSPSIRDDSERVTSPVADAVCGGIAVLLVLHREWVRATPDRESWCRRWFEEILRTPPPFSFFDSDSSAGDLHWDAFAAECGIILLAENPDDSLARFLTAVGVMAYRYSTIALTLRSAFQIRRRLGEDFGRLLHLAVNWSVVRSLRDRAAQLQFDDERWQQEYEQLRQSFLDRSLSPEPPTLAEANDRALVELEDLLRRRFPEEYGEESQHLRPGLDPQVLQFAYSWLDLREACSAEERHAWLRVVRELMVLALGMLPTHEDPNQQEIDRSPGDFERWVFSLLARSIPHMRTDEDPRSFWQPILDLGTRAHHWVEDFFWDWFTDGLQAAGSPEAFTGIWEEMIRYVLRSKSWDPELARFRDLDDMVCGLLGFHRTLFAADERYTVAIWRMTSVFADASRRWFRLPRVAHGFAQFVVRPAAAQLLFPGVVWLLQAVQQYDEHDWEERELAEDLVEVLRACWDRDGQRVSGDPQVRDAFLGLLTKLVSRGGHAAFALQERVLNSLGRASS